jgi:hypothetical protein
MNDPIGDFIKVLNNNAFESKVREIPDDFDNKDELLAYLDMEDSIPQSMIDFELNGFSSPVDFEDFLETNYKSFKISILEISVNRNDELIAEILGQISASKLALTQLRCSYIASNDITFKSLVELKILYCEKAVSFLEEKFKIIKETGEVIESSILSDFAEREIGSEKENLNEHAPLQDHLIYIFRIRKGIQNSDYKIATLHKELKLKGYIDCSLPQFRKLFLLDKKPKQSPEPIIWKCQTYYHFSYFIQCLHRTFLSYSKKPSNLAKARKLFCMAEGVPFNTKKERFDLKSDEAQDVKAIFDKIMNKCGLTNPTTAKKKPTS